MSAAWLWQHLPLRTWTARRWMVLTLSALLVASLPAALSATEWLEATAIVWWAALAAGLWGLALARLVRHPLTGGLLALAGGVLFIAQFQGRILPPALPALRELWQIARWAVAQIGIWWLDHLPYLNFSPSPTASPALPEWNAVALRAWLYLQNLAGDWPPHFASRQWGTGQFLLGGMLGLAVWLDAALIVWLLVRRAGWAALVGALCALGPITYLAPDVTGVLVWAVVCGLFLAADDVLSRLLGCWEAGAFPYGLELGWWLLAGGVALLAAFSMMVAITVTDPDFGQWVDDTFSPDRSRGQAAPDAGQDRSSPSDQDLGTWPREHLLVGGIELAEQPAMTVQTPDAAPDRFYWRATSYDQYTGQGWLQNAGEELPNGATPLLWPETVEPPPGQALLRQIFHLESPSYQVYAAGHPVQLSHPARGLWLDSQMDEPVAVRSLTALSAYQVYAWVPSVTSDRLQAASEEYPKWVEETYLALPDGLPQRVIDLADEIAHGADTPFDRALAMQTYLRMLNYSLDLPDPPPEQDRVDYFLFDLRQGYCDYFASAMVIMARTQGLPARLVVGYATGQFDPVGGVYRVSKADAHSWAEIYFPGYGWIPFEPTPAQPALDYQAVAGWEWQSGPLPQASFPSADEEDETARFGAWLWLPLAAIPAAALLAGGGLLIAIRRVAWLRRLPPHQSIAALYGDLLQWGGRLGAPPDLTLTPHEYGARFRARARLLAGRGPGRPEAWIAYEQAATFFSDEVIALYATACYSPRLPAHEQVDRLIAAWPHFVRAAWLLRLAGIFHRNLKRISPDFISSLVAFHSFYP